MSTKKTRNLEMTYRTWSPAAPHSNYPSLQATNQSPTAIIAKTHGRLGEEERGSPHPPMQMYRQGKIGPPRVNAYIRSGEDRAILRVIVWQAYVWPLCKDSDVRFLAGRGLYYSDSGHVSGSLETRRGGGLNCVTGNSNCLPIWRESKFCPMLAGFLAYNALEGSGAPSSGYLLLAWCGSIMLGYYLQGILDPMWCGSKELEQRAYIHGPKRSIDDRAHYYETRRVVIVIVYWIGL